LTAKAEKPVAQFPNKFRFLFKPARYKVAYGGRYGLKSWSFARSLLILGAERPLRILCTREVQKSIKASVHTLLADQIKALGLSSVYKVIDTEIRGSNGTRFLFTGLSEHTVESVKSYEGVDIVWVEEGQTVKNKSWKILIPTIRKAGSEIWVSFNPDLDTDPTYVRFVVNTPTDCVLVKSGWQDMPDDWMTPEIKQERLDCEKFYPDDYPNIWEGMCKTVVDGAIYGKEIISAVESGQICHVPYDPKLKVHVVFDLGWNDSMSIGLFQRGTSDIRCIGFIEDDHKTLNYYSAELKKLEYNWGLIFLPHDGETKNIQTGRSAREILQSLSWDVAPKVPNLRVETGIKMVRESFHQLYFDKVATTEFVNHLKRYRRNIPSTTGEASTPLHDDHSHAADMLRYAVISVEEMTNEDFGSMIIDANDLLPSRGIAI